MIIKVIANIIKNIIAWALTVCCAALAFECLPGLCGVLSVVAVVLLFPVEIWQSILNCILPRFIRFIIVIALCVGIVYTAPPAKKSDGLFSLNQTSSVHTHDFAPADCKTPKTCKTCGVTEGDVLPHSYVDGKCSECDADDLSYKGGVHVWVPTKGGDMYHIESTCSQMIDPRLITLDEAKAEGFPPCSKCYP